VIRLLIWIGFVRRDRNGKIVWPFRVPPKHMCSTWPMFLMYCRYIGWKPYRFRNLPHVIKWVPGRLLPRRWGFGWLGFEFGDRGG